MRHARSKGSPGCGSAREGSGRTAVRLPCATAGIHSAKKPKRRIALRVAGWVTLAATVGLFVAAVIGYLGNPQETGKVDLTLPTLVMVAGLAAVWCVVAPVLWESHAVGIRVRNLILGGLITFILIPIGTALVVSLASLIADLLSNFV